MLGLLDESKSFGHLLLGQSDCCDWSTVGVGVGMDEEGVVDWKAKVLFAKSRCWRGLGTGSECVALSGVGINGQGTNGREKGVVAFLQVRRTFDFPSHGSAATERKHGLLSRGKYHSSL